MGTSECGDRQMLQLLKSLFGHNSSAWDSALQDASDDCQNASGGNASLATPSLGGDHALLDFTVPRDHGDISTHDYGILLYAFMTPFIISTGLIGNTISLRVFASRQLRKLSASLYLASISISDSLVLVTYVFLEWLNKGLPRLPGGHRLAVINVQGVCQVFLYFSYTFRFVSVWILVLFTVERYIAACRPLQRRVICTKTFGRRAVLSIIAIGALLSIYKPLLSGLFQPSMPSSGFGISLLATNSQLDFEPLYTPLDGAKGSYICARNPDYDRVNFIMELTYGLLITAVPFLVIAVFNMLILKTIMQRDASIRKWKIAFIDSRIRWEFTVTLLVVSSSFICLNLPYFVTWCQQFLQSMSPDDPEVAHRNRNQLFITKTVYNVNYCINFFLYCLTGTYYRRQLAALFGCRRRQKQAGLPRKSSSSFLTGSTKL